MMKRLFAVMILSIIIIEPSLLFSIKMKSL